MSYGVAKNIIAVPSYGRKRSEGRSSLGDNAVFALRVAASACPQEAGRDISECCFAHLRLKKSSIAGFWKIATPSTQKSSTGSHSLIAAREAPKTNLTLTSQAKIQGQMSGSLLKSIAQPAASRSLLFTFAQDSPARPAPAAHENCVSFRSGRYL